MIADARTVSDDAPPSRRWRVEHGCYASAAGLRHVITVSHGCGLSLAVEPGRSAQWYLRGGNSAGVPVATGLA